MKLKVCGINDKNILQSIIKLDVDYVGFIFFENSPRCVNLDFIREISVFDFKKKQQISANLCLLCRSCRIAPQVKLLISCV